MNPGYFDHLDYAIRALDLLIHHVEQTHCYTHTHDIEQRTRLTECMPHLEQLRLTLDELNPENNVKKPEDLSLRDLDELLGKFP